MGDGMKNSELARLLAGRIAERSRMSEPHRFPPDAKIPLEEITRATRHVFLCAGPDCCDPSEGEALWSLLKAEMRKLSVPALRTKAACLRICKSGPWLVVYPDGIWYGDIDSHKLGAFSRNTSRGVARSVSGSRQRCQISARNAEWRARSDECRN